MKKMKKIVFALVTAGMLAVSLTGCGKSSDDQASGGSVQSGLVDDAKQLTGYNFSYNGTVIAPNMDMAELQTKLGDPVSYFESESCAFQGMDKTYTYNSFVIKTYPDGDKDYVLSVTLKDDTVSTNEGVTIGAAKQTVLDYYGEGEDTNGSLIYTNGDTKLTFLISGDKVTQIDYSAVK